MQEMHLADRKAHFLHILSSTDRHFFSSIFFSITSVSHFIVTFNKDGKERTALISFSLSIATKVRAGAI